MTRALLRLFLVLCFVATVAAWHQTDARPASCHSSGHPNSRSCDRFDRLAACESARDRDSGPYHGYFQATRYIFNATSDHFHRKLHRDPHVYKYRSQYAMAKLIASWTTPRHQWPYCWPHTA